MSAVDVSVCAMYDGEARESRLLDRSRLSPQDQRLVLVGSRYSLTFEDISESLVMRLPDFKPPPPVIINKAKGTGKFGNQNHLSQTQDQGSGQGTGKCALRKVLVTETGENADDNDQGDEAASEEHGISCDSDEGAIVGMLRERLKYCGSGESAVG